METYLKATCNHSYYSMIFNRKCAVFQYMYGYVIYTSRKKFPYENNCCCFYKFRDLLFYFKTSLRQSFTMWFMLDFHSTAVV